jgi:hypothetical protein
MYCVMTVATVTSKELLYHMSRATKFAITTQQFPFFWLLVFFDVGEILDEEGCGELVMVAESEVRELLENRLVVPVWRGRRFAEV